MADEFAFALKAEALGLNENRAVEIGGRSVLLCRTKDGVFAVENQCTHQLQSLEGGKIRGCFLFCPLHGQRFNLKDGAPLGALTDKPLKTFRVRLEGEDILVNPHPCDAGRD